jgi:hypothetical protein
MNTRTPRAMRSLSLVALGLSVVIIGLPAGVARAAPLDYGNGCALDPENRAVTLDALRFRCSPQQAEQIYVAAGPGTVPVGVMNGWVTNPPPLALLAPPFWIGKTFYTGPNGGMLQNRLTGAGFEAWPAIVSIGPSWIDGKPTWVLDYAPSPTPPIHDEIREITPGVWFGYSYWHGIFASPQLLAFAVA